MRAELEKGIGLFDRCEHPDAGPARNWPCVLCIRQRIEDRAPALAALVDAPLKVLEDAFDEATSGWDQNDWDSTPQEIIEALAGLPWREGAP